MKKTESRIGGYSGSGKKTRDLAALLLLGIFAVSILTVLLFGAKIYRNLTERDKHVYDSRTAVSYLSMKVRQSDIRDSVEIRETDGTDVLVFKESLDGIGYETLIYCYDGYLCELFTVSMQQEGTVEEGFLAGGNRLLEAASLELEMNNECLLITLKDAAGKQSHMELKLRSGKEVAS